MAKKITVRKQQAKSETVEGNALHMKVVDGHLEITDRDAKRVAALFVPGMWTSAVVESD